MVWVEIDELNGSINALVTFRRKQTAARIIKRRGKKSKFVINVYQKAQLSVFVCIKFESNNAI